MESPLQGRLLFLGEGDFSFAVSFIEKCGFPSDQIVATSLETRETIQKHGLATDNVERLREKGVEVLFEVDATDLQSSLSLHVTEDSKFSRIIFNFPHSGGKLNLKKNRTLLNNFFSSAVKVLDAEGQIFVTLCKGQGGTPADQPMREWHDSWQVVSMAANSSLILTQVEPFNSSEYPEYNSVGFRSQDKGFNTEGALTHVFETAESVCVPDIVEEGQLAVQGKTYICDKYLEEKMNRKLLYCPGHPLQQLRSVIEKQVSNVLGGQDHHLDNTSVVKTGHWPEVCGQSDEEKITQNLQHKEPRLIEDKPTPTVESNPHQTAGSKNMEKTQSDSWLKAFFPKPYFLREIFRNRGEISVKERENEEEKEQDESEVGTEREDKQFQADLQNLPNLHLRSSVLQELPALVTMMATSGVEYHMVSCDIYGQHLIGHNFPIGHQLLIASQYSDLDKKIWNLCCCLQNATNFYYEAVQMDDVFVESNFEHLYASHRVYIIPDESDEGEVCGCIFKWTHPDNDCALLLMVLKLDVLAFRVFSIPCPALLWSVDSRFKKQFTEKHSSVQKFQPFSLYPMKYFHDLSFWESGECEFDEVDFHRIIRNVAGDLVTRVQLMDIYYDDVSSRRSRCYRLTFQSHDQAISYITSWKLQSILRLEVAKQMGIMLR